MHPAFLATRHTVVSSGAVTRLHSVSQTENLLLLTHERFLVDMCAVIITFKVHERIPVFLIFAADDVHDGCNFSDTLKWC